MHSRKALLVNLLLFAIALFFMLGCDAGNAEAGSQNEQPNPASKTSPAARETMDRRTRDAVRFQELNAVKVENKISPFRYVTSTPQFSIFAQLVKASTHSRVIHGNGVTLLCPTDAAFAQMDNWKLLLRSGNQEEIDDFVAHHVLLDVMTYNDFKLLDRHETLAGEDVVVETTDGIFANDAHVRSGYVATENGSVIGLDDIMYVPFSLR